MEQRYFGNNADRMDDTPFKFSSRPIHELAEPASGPCFPCPRPPLVRELLIVIGRRAASAPQPRSFRAGTWRASSRERNCDV